MTKIVFEKSNKKQEKQKQEIKLVEKHSFIENESFAAICDKNYYIGLWALLNSIYLYNGDKRKIFIIEMNMTEEQKSSLYKHKLNIELINYKNVPYPSEGAWEVKQQIFDILMNKTKIVYLLDVDLVVCSNLNDVFELAKTGKICSCQDGNQVKNYNHDFISYGEEILGKSMVYYNSGSVCIDIHRHWTLAALWSFSSRFGLYSHKENNPLKLVGHGDQGLLNPCTALLNKEKCVFAPQQDDWCNVWGTEENSPKIIGADMNGALNIINRKTKNTQRMLHSSGPKWWTKEGKEHNKKRGDIQQCFEYFKDFPNKYPFER